MENEEIQTLTKSTPNCTMCNSKNTAIIFWGYPGDMDWYLKAVEEKEIVGGGCVVTDHDPKWECNECHHRWGDSEHNELDKIDSFDYDLGFNIKEVYDQ